MLFQLVIDRPRVLAPFEGNRQQAGRLIHDDEGIVFVHDAQAARTDSGAFPCAARPIHPQRHDVPGRQAPGGIFTRCFVLVDENLAPLEHRHRAPAQPEPVYVREKFIETRAGFPGVDGPARSRRTVLRGHGATYAVFTIV